jgi:hypothetical protein
MKLSADSPQSDDSLLDSIGAMSIGDDTQCPYCHQTYRQPRLLHCLHALCEDCIVAQLERRPDESQMRHGRHARAPPVAMMTELEPSGGSGGSQAKPAPGVIRCPVCNQDSQVGNDLRFINNLLTDYVTRNMLDSRAITQRQQDCESCKNREKAIAKCKECDKFICNHCVNVSGRCACAHISYL